MAQIWLAENWDAYELIDCGGGEKLERWGDFVLSRPEPQAIWPKQRDWIDHADAHYHRSAGGGQWEYVRRIPDFWEIGYKKLTFRVRTMGFKHTGLFPEQAVNWDWMTGLIGGSEKQIHVLNLFAYTGGATIACAAAGASVCHVDAAKGMVAQAKENAALCGLESAPIRWIVDDCGKFVQRELRRGRRYDAIIMDPPSYGRGPDGEMWRLEDQLWELTRDCAQLLSDTPLFFLINSYTTGISAAVAETVLRLALEGRGGHAEASEIGLPITRLGMALPCGCSARWVGGSL